MKVIRIIAGVVLLLTSFLAQATPIRYDVTGHITSAGDILTDFKVDDSFTGWLQFDWDVIYNTTHPTTDGQGNDEYWNALSYHFIFADYTIYSDLGVMTRLKSNRPKILDGSYIPWDNEDIFPMTSLPNVFIEEMLLSSSGFDFYYWKADASYENPTTVLGSITSIGQGYAVVPEPPSIALLFLGLIGTFLARKRAFFRNQQ